MIPPEIEVKCLALAHGGSMICEITTGTPEIVGKKAFVPGLIPGEVATVSIREDKKSFVMADLLQIKTSSHLRIVPPCPVFGTCGGCDLQYMPLEQQRELKREMFEKTLQRQAGLTLPEPVRLLGADLPGFGYRKRISLHLNLEGKLGFFREGSGDVVAFSECLIASEKINLILPALQEVARQIAATVAGVSIEEFSGKAIPLFQLRPDRSHHQIEELLALLKKKFQLGKIFFRSSQTREWHTGLSQGEALEFSTLSHFSQINQEGNQILIEEVLNSLSAEKEVSEFYAGAGNFSLPLARAGKLVDAIELDAQLVALGSDLARAEGLNRLKFIKSSTERYLEGVNSILRTSVILDPPRSGARALCESLSPEHVKTICYVSCALPTLARDLGILVKSGYILGSVAILDMFSQTHHVESISVLKAP